MQRLVASCETTASGPANFDAVLPPPQPRTRSSRGGRSLRTRHVERGVLPGRGGAGVCHAGRHGASPTWMKRPFTTQRHSSQPGVNRASRTRAPGRAAGAVRRPPPTLIDLTKNLAADGAACGPWDVARQMDDPAVWPHDHRPDFASFTARGSAWSRTNSTRPGSTPHFDAIEALLRSTDEPNTSPAGDWSRSFDGWEMSSQDSSGKFREEFTRRRRSTPGASCRRWSATSVQTSRGVGAIPLGLRPPELVVENHAMRLKELGHRHGLQFSLEPYDLEPLRRPETWHWACADGRSWSKGWAFPTELQLQ